MREKIFETHAHYEDKRFDEDREELLLRLSDGGVGTVVNVGSSIETTKASVELARKYDFIYAAVGVHPEECAKLTDEDIDWLESLAKEQKVVAIGEIGLDYYWDEPEREIQKKWFERQILLAGKVGLPMIIHSRDAAKDTLDILRGCKGEEAQGVVHCFSYSKEIARECLDMGFYIGIGGVLTFKNAKKLREVAEYVPLDRILLETDCPYMAPEPHRGKRNCSLYLTHVAEKLAKLKHVEVEEIIRVTAQNARDMYKIN